jgi:hypothetical protein
MVAEIPSDLIDRAGSRRFRGLFEAVSEQGRRWRGLLGSRRPEARGGSGACGGSGPSAGVRDPGLWCWGLRRARGFPTLWGAARRPGWAVQLAQDDQVAATITRDLLKRPQVAAKVPTEDKARVVEEFTRDETAAAAAATNLLRRPAVAFKAMSDDTARSPRNIRYCR